MKLGSILAIYALFWVLSFFCALPFGVRTDEEMGTERIAGQAESAPYKFSFGLTSLRATLISAVAFGLFYANYVYGWVGVEAIDWIAPPKQG